MKNPADLLYTKSHEWVRKLDDGSVQVGLTDYAQHQLGDLVFIGLPQEGDAVTAGESFCDAESVKAVSEVYSPVTGTVLAINEELLDHPELVNENPYDAWFVQIGEITGEEELLGAAEYEELAAKEEK